MNKVRTKLTEEEFNDIVKELQLKHPCWNLGYLKDIPIDEFYLYYKGVKMIRVNNNKYAKRTIFCYIGRVEKGVYCKK